MVKRVCSGGQTGSDLGGLQAARDKGVPTGGWATKGFRTEDGPKPELGTEFGLKEHESAEYQKRTAANVKDSDGTIRFAANFKTAGERCTFNNIKWYNRPYFDVDVKNPPPHEDVVAWLRANKIETLNVAGNRESTHIGIGQFVREYLGLVLEMVKHDP